jgi:hypothetical protein
MSDDGTFGFTDYELYERGLEELSANYVPDDLTEDQWERTIEFVEELLDEGWEWEDIYDAMYEDFWEWYREQYGEG